MVVTLVTLPSVEYVDGSVLLFLYHTEAQGRFKSGIEYVTPDADSALKSCLVRHGEILIKIIRCTVHNNGFEILM